MSEVQIWCKDALHVKPVLVMEYRQQERSSGSDLAAGNLNTRWYEVVPKRGPRSRRDRSPALLDGDRATGGALNAVGLSLLNESGFRARVKLACYECERRPVEARWENLVSILDTLAANGIPELTLPQLAARLRRR